MEVFDSDLKTLLKYWNTEKNTFQSFSTDGLLNDGIVRLTCQLLSI